MSARRVNRFWGLLPLAFGAVLAVEGVRGLPRSGLNGLLIPFGLLLVASGVYTLATGLGLSRWR